MGMKSRKGTRASNVIHNVTHKTIGTKSTRKEVRTPATVNIIRIHWMDILLLSTGIFSGYLLTLYPTIAGGDSGELVAESCHLGMFP